MVTARIISILIGYLCGMFSTGYIYGKTKHVDIRTMGSGNAGATNTHRNLGVKAGLVTLTGDVMKSVLAIVVTYLLFRERHPEMVRVFMLYAGFGAIIGHNFPAPLKFKGGKGVSCSAGVLFAFCPFEAPVCVVIFFLTVFCTRYVSLGSILALVTFFVQTLIFGHFGFFHVPQEGLMEIYIISGIIMVMGIWRHKSNIQRLVTGTENKFSLHTSRK